MQKLFCIVGMKEWPKGTENRTNRFENASDLQAFHTVLAWRILRTVQHRCNFSNIKLTEKSQCYLLYKGHRHWPWCQLNFHQTNAVFLLTMEIDVEGRVVTTNLLKRYITSPLNDNKRNGWTFAVIILVLFCMSLIIITSLSTGLASESLWQMSAKLRSINGATSGFTEVQFSLVFTFGKAIKIRYNLALIDSNRQVESNQQFYFSFFNKNEITGFVFEILLTNVKKG